MKELLSFIIENLIGTKDFSVEENVDEGGFVHLKLILPSEYIGQVIGKGGKIINAIRSILRAKATLTHQAFRLEIAEKQNSSS